MVSVFNNDWGISCVFLKNSLCISLLHIVFKLSCICYKFVWQSRVLTNENEFYNLLVFLVGELCRSKANIDS